MKIFFVTDLEGIAGAECWEQTREEGELKNQSMVQLTKEVNACVDGILDAEPQAEVVVWDGHGSEGIIKDDFHPKAEYVRESGVHGNFDKSFDALFFVGQHAMVGTAFAPLAHTYSSRTISYYRLNGYFVGEFSMRAAYAGSIGVPTVFISGDDKCVMSARTFVPEIYGAVVKWGLGLQKAKHLSSDEACQVIREVATEATRNIDKVQPLIIEPPYEFEARYYNPRDFSNDEREGLTQIDERTIVIKTDDFLKLPL
ncbi:M55 family metallopeptidase [bacterium]|nr:M55 family metallopeptidase [bacterium]